MNYETEQSVSMQQSGNFSYKAARTQFQKGEVRCLVRKLQLPLFTVEEKQGFKHIKTGFLVTVSEFFCFGCASDLSHYKRCTCETLLTQTLCTSLCLFLLHSATYCGYIDIIFEQVLTLNVLCGHAVHIERRKYDHFS
jgi:hypothetical protein